MPQWIKIAEHEADTVVELQQEEDGTVLMENLKNVFSQATTIKYRNPENNAWRVIKCVDDILHPPEDVGWGDHVYVVVVPKGRQVERKRKAVSLTPPVESPPIVLNKAIYVLFDANRDLCEQDFKDYFSEFGTISNINGQYDKGFAFVTFEDEAVPFKLYGKPVTINGVELDIKEPENDSKEPRKLALLWKENTITTRQIREFFQQYGEVTDVYITKPFRKYGFCTFSEPRPARELYDTSVTIGDVKVLCTKPRPKMAKEDKIEYGGPGGYGRAGYGGRGGHHGGWGGGPGGGWGGGGGGGHHLGGGGWGPGNGMAGGFGNFGGNGRSRNGNY